MPDKKVDRPDEVSFIKEITQHIPSSSDSKRNTYVMVAGILAGKALKNATKRR